MHKEIGKLQMTKEVVISAIGSLMTIAPIILLSLDYFMRLLIPSRTMKNRGKFYDAK